MEKIRKPRPIGRAILLFLLTYALLIAVVSISALALFQGKFFIPLIIVGLGSMVSGLKDLRRKKEFENRMKCKIHAIAMGPTEVSGTVIGKNTFKSWFSQKECVYCRIAVYRKRKNWCLEFEKEHGERFYLQDETGKVLVDSTEAEMDLEQSFNSTANSFHPFEKHISDFLSENNILEKIKPLLWGDEPISLDQEVIEYTITPGQTVYVWGTAGDNPEQEEGFAAQGSMDVMIQKNKNDFYVISDKNESSLIQKETFRKGNFWWSKIIIGIIITVSGLFFGNIIFPTY